MYEALTMTPVNTLRKTSVLKRVLWIVIALLLTVSLGQIAFQLFISPNLLIAHVHVESDVPISEEEVLGIAGLQGNEYYFSLNAEHVRERLEQYPVVKEAIVRKVFPDTLKIGLIGRKPLAAALVDVGGKSVPLCFDEEGVVIQIGRAIADWDLPVVSGLKFGDVKIGMKLPQMLLSFLGDLGELKRRTPGLFRAISEVRIVPLRSSEYELVLYPISHSIRVRIGSELDEQVLQYTMLVLDVMAKQDVSEDVREIDFRTGEVIYRNTDESEEG